MNLARPWRKWFLFALLSGGLLQNALACHEASSSAETAPPEVDSRTFLIDLHLDKSGTVRAAQVWIGDGPLRGRAVKAAVTKKYRPRLEANPAVTTVEVKFPQHSDRRPRVREVGLGVSSCVTGPAPVSGAPWVNELLSAHPLLPFLLSGRSEP